MKKNETENSCKGSCHLNKELEKEKQKEHKQPQKHDKEFTQYQLYIEPLNELSIIAHKTENKQSFLYSDFIGRCASKNIFHPPALG
ncbi:MAG: hypothetical protein ACLGGV_01530 [Bacteroidia bacterium]